MVQLDHDLAALVRAVFRMKTYHYITIKRIKNVGEIADTKVAQQTEIGSPSSICVRARLNSPQRAQLN